MITDVRPKVVALDAVNPADGREEYERLLLLGEEVKLSYKSIRDRAVFTDKRIIIIDKQGITGKKREFMFIPFKNIVAYSVETSGKFDLDSEFKFWLSGMGKMELQFMKKTDILALADFLNTVISV